MLQLEIDEKNIKTEHVHHFESYTANTDLLLACSQLAILHPAFDFFYFCYYYLFSTHNLLRLGYLLRNIATLWCSLYLLKAYVLMSILY